MLLKIKHITFVSGKKFGGIYHIEVLFCHRSKYGSEVCCHWQIPVVFQRGLVQRTHLVVYFSAPYIIAQYKKTACPSMVCSSGSVLVYCSSKLCHGHHGDLILVACHVFPKRSNAV